jgi:hypothetical protein
VTQTVARWHARPGSTRVPGGRSTRPALRLPTTTRCSRSRRRPRVRACSSPLPRCRRRATPCAWSVCRRGGRSARPSSPAESSKPTPARSPSTSTRPSTSAAGVARRCSTPPAGCSGCCSPPVRARAGARGSASVRFSVSSRLWPSPMKEGSDGSSRRSHRIRAPRTTWSPAAAPRRLARIPPCTPPSASTPRLERGPRRHRGRALWHSTWSSRRPAPPSAKGPASSSRAAPSSPCPGASASMSWW